MSPCSLLFLTVEGSCSIASQFSAPFFAREHVPLLCILHWQGDITSSGANERAPNKSYRDRLGHYLKPSPTVLRDRSLQLMRPRPSLLSFQDLWLANSCGTTAWHGQQLIPAASTDFIDDGRHNINIPTWLLMPGGGCYSLISWDQYFFNW